MNNQMIILNYSIQCDEELNPPEAVARNEFRARLTVNYIESIQLIERSDDDIRSYGSSA